MANRQILTRIAAITGLLVVLILGVIAYSVFRTPAEASGSIEAIPLAESTTGSADSTATAGLSATEISAATPTEQPAAEVTPSAAATAETATADAASTDIPAQAAAPAASSDPVVLQIVQEESEVRFIIDEVLNGAPKTVVGTTNQVAGQIEVDPQDPTRSRVGVIQVNARTLSTDSDMRNRAIANRILSTSQYEFVTFTPTRLEGLPQTGAVGQSYTFQVVGDLTRRDVTREVTFDMTVNPISESRLEGSGNTTIRYADYGLTIPQVRQVASVDEEVRIELDFVAAAQS